MRGFRARALAVMASGVVVASACVVPPPPISTQPQEVADYVISPPDKLKITIRPEPEIEREVMVRPDGRIGFELIGEVDAEGRTLEQVRQEIDRRIRKFIVNPDVTVTLEESNSRFYYVVGEVNQVGAYPLQGRVRAMEGLARAGGETQRAALNAARLTRTTPGAEGVYPIRFRDIQERADVRTNYELQAGDVIYVAPNTAAQIGYAIGVVFFPLQQLIGLGGSTILRVVSP